MSPHDSGVTELLRRASDDLTVDVDRLVRGGITRGRSRQRRARIGTTVASLAVIGVVGALATVVPQDGDPDGARDLGVATEGASATELPTPAPKSSAPPRLVPIAAADIPAFLAAVTGADGVGEPRPADAVVDDGDEHFVMFPVDGMTTSVGVAPKGLPDPEACRAEAEQAGNGTCDTTDDGGWFVEWGPTAADGVTCQGATVYRNGYEIWATSCNAAEAKDSTPLTDQPPLGKRDLASFVLSDDWFE